MGHLNITNLIHKLSKVINKQKCIICSKAKLRITPFQDSPNQAKEVLELLHFDLVGPISESIYRSKYIFTILDDFSKVGFFFQIINETHSTNLKNDIRKQQIIFTKV